MPSENAPDPAFEAAALTSLLAFWSDAGVDAAYAETPIDRLAEVARRRPPPAAPTAGASSAPPDGEPSTPDLPARVEVAWRAARGAADLPALDAAARALHGVEPTGAWASSRGAQDATVMVVGEAPSAEDEAEGRAFAGAPGRLLDRMLAAAGLDGRAWLTHAVPRRPAAAGAATAEEVALGLPFLRRAAELLRPRAVLLLGEGAARAVLGQGGGIMTLRGRWFDWEAQAGTIPAVATFHPVFLLRQPLAKKRAWEDRVTLAARVDQANGRP